MYRQIKIDRSSYDPIYQQLARAFRELIVTEKLSEGDKLLPEPELASILAINRLTLRKSLKLLEAQGLIVQRKGRGTFVTYAKKMQHRIGLCFPYNKAKVLDSSFALMIFHGVMATLSESSGIEVVLLGREQPNAKSIMKEFNDMACDGLIIIGGKTKFINEICKPQFDKIPTIILFSDRAPAESDMYNYRVWIESSKGVINNCMTTLIELGHRRIIYLTTDSMNSNQQIRNKEFEQTVIENNITDTTEMIIISNTPSWYDTARDIIKKICSQPEHPTAIICAGRVFAYGAWQGIMEAGLKIPENISIIGMDCDEDANPYLSSINVDIIEMGNISKTIITDLLEHRTVLEKHIHLNAKLLDRGSIAKTQTLK
jgi:DNA-binding LacI/PurR family transcriptional regulator